ncbi:MAG TPA: tripartite tricarboxylate transporter substrate-binding protein, partial [Burkholderiaceae bacterium]|nr:tripartite tricarboxylate transporter substrate-binding protein [Burkholderiaceae bacterium]
MDRTTTPEAARRRTLATLGAALGAATLPGALRAQGAPAIDTVRVVTGFPPGGTSDTICRRVAEKLKGTYARNAVVENRTGAGGLVGAQAVLRSPADGNTMIMNTASSAVFAALTRDPAPF